ncbi:DNA-binding response regulator [Paenibacillus aurantius]|uniref:DNA-binding response regulator n=1 Tax=Paenibacillus aurantius TaxID=2918900 RepID=A0AA96LDI2_9BACL|nr:DNA-binding response regulator [Paenibacillus aurantius]WNQ11179.1 DNA-binding response regulator [Paenibacillus aurantius]
MEFDKAYEAFIEKEKKQAAGSRRERLRLGQGHAEKAFLKEVWWPAFGHFEHLHVEYEVQDFKDGIRYLDYAYLRPPYRICFEIDGFGPHARDLSRWQFADNLLRQNHLVMDHWTVLRFSYDDITEKPRRCQQMIQQLMGRWFGDEASPPDLNYRDKEIVRLAVHKQGAITPRDVSQRLSITTRYARALLHKLVDQGILLPATGNERVRSFRLAPQGRGYFL